MTSRVFHACRIPEECVRVTFLLISSSPRPLHPVHFKIFLAQIFYLEVHISRARNCSRAYTKRENISFWKVRGRVIVVYQCRFLPLPCLAFSYETQLRV